MSLPTFRFVHAADLHLDAPFRGLRRASPAITHTLAHAPLAAWDALVQLTIDQHAAFLLLAGDVCDGAERAAPAQLRFLNGLQRLSAHGIRTFIVRGDEDPPERWTGIHQWPEGVHCFGAHALESVAVTRAGERIATIHGLSHNADRASSRVARFARGSESGIHIGLLHAGISSGGLGPADCCSTGDLEAAGMDYWALGHDHRHRQPTTDRPWIVYPGTLQGRSLADDEIGPKGAVVVTVADGVVRHATPHALEVVQLMRPRVDVSAFGSVAELRSALFEIHDRIRGERQGRTVVASGEIAGRLPRWMGARVADPVWDSLLEELRQQGTSGGTCVWWDSLRDLTELSESGHHNDASAYVHRLAEVMRRAPASLDRILSEHGVALAPAMLGGGATLDANEIDGLLGKAERVALSLLEREQL